MKIAMLTDHVRGGAGIAATRLSVGLARRGHEIARLHADGESPPAGSAGATHRMKIDSEWPERWWTVLKLESVRRAVQRGWVRTIEPALRRIEPDVINVHNLHSAGWDIEVAEACARVAPVVWTLHDMWAFTGSCAYAMECRKYVSGCDRECAQQGVHPTLPPHLVGSAHARRRAFYAGESPPVFVAPSGWLAESAAEALPEGCAVRRVDYGLDVELIAPLPKAEARDLLRVPEDDRVNLLMAAASLDDDRKGVRLLLDALGRLDCSGIRLLLLGSAVSIDAPSGLEILHLGSVGGDRMLRAPYSAADLFVHPSRADNQPLVVLEAMACARPVLGLPVGGVRELIRPDETGWLAADASPAALALSLEQALDERERWDQMGRTARSIAETRHALELQAQRYEEVFAAAAGGEPIPGQEELDAIRAGGA